MKNMTYELFHFHFRFPLILFFCSLLMVTGCFTADDDEDEDDGDITATSAVVVAKPIVDSATTKKAQDVLDKLNGNYQKNPAGDIVSFSLTNQEVSPEVCTFLAELTALVSYSLTGLSGQDDVVITLQYLPNIETISIENGDITDAALAAIATHPKLKQLYIQRCLKLVSLDSIQNMPKLEQLDILFNSFGNSTMLKNLPKVQTLKSLDIRGIDAVDNLTLKYIAKLENLESFRVKFAKDDGVEYLAACQNLARLELLDADVSPVVCDVFKKLPKLKTLRIFRAPNFGEEGIAGLQGLSLETLELRDLTASPEAIYGLAAMKTLKTLELSELTDIESADILTLLKSLPNLQRVRIFSIMVDDTIPEYLATRPQLRDIALPCTAISDKGLAAMSTLPNLTALDIHGNKERISLEGANVLAKYPKLQTLILPETLQNDSLFEAIKKTSPKCNISVKTYTQGS